MVDTRLGDGTVWLSRPGAADVDAIVECCQEPSIGEWTTIPVPYRREHAEMFLAEIVAPGWDAGRPTWAVRESADGPVVGMVGVTGMVLHGGHESSAAEIGYWLSPRVRGRGLMTRAVRLACDFGFRSEGLAVQRIEWRAMVGNHASAAVARRTGFRYEGLLRLGGEQRGRRRDVWIAGRLATDPAGPVDGWPDGV
ncbi:GNAT family N-acetyltransferase [Nocardia mexicana]|uniref:RimJ/RimL family protein N-acetyltransferase n=1 Tax=Nocardia mexicana TaxID=279262 RepID=A0A370GJS2_9NOCA|nr:GNAT family protein [Nocardia mexicana]RDI43509.1 RimJ/RimL family protein N-acetyltransferase [Nocardia mexicana]